MGFLAPAMLFGAAAVSVPVALHFLFKPRYRPLPWAAMALLRQSLEQTSRRFRFQEWVLLLLRCLGVLLLAAALARPSCSVIPAGGRGEGVDAVLVFDLSYSLGAKDGEAATRFYRAKAAATAVIDGLPANSTVQVVTFADRAAAVGPVSPRNLDQARHLVAGLELTGQAGDVLAGLTEAAAALDRGAGANKEVYLFTDLQKSGWDRQAGAVRGKAEEIRGRPAALVVVRCGDPNILVPNVAVADITYPGSIPHTSPDAPTRLPITVLLRNTGREPVRDLTVTLEVDGRTQETESGAVREVGAGQTFPVTLTARLDHAGPTLLTARVAADGLPGDDRLDRIIPVRDRVRVLVVDGTPDARDPTRSGSHFLVNALVPVPDARRDDYFVKATVVPPEEAIPVLLGAADVCFFCNVPALANDRPGVPALSKEFADRLTRFVRDGGGLVVGGGENVSAGSYNAAFGFAGSGLLPFDLAGAATAAADATFKPAPDSAESPGFLARFRDPPYSTVTADADLLGLMTVQDGGRPGGRVLMRLTDGRPWLTARAVGDGEVVFVGTSLDAAWTNWPAKAGSYLSFVRFTLAHLTGTAARGANVVAGRPIVYHPSEAARGFDLIRPPPDHRRVRLGKARGGADGEKLTVGYADTTAAGVYRIVPEGEDSPAAPRFAVAPDLRESESLDPLTDAELEMMLGFRPVLIQAGSDATATLSAERGRRELTVWVLLLLFGVAATETTWAWLCGRAW